MAKDQKVTITFNMSDETEKPISFIVPGGKDGKNGTDGKDGKDGAGGLPTIPADDTPEQISAQDFIDKMMTAKYDRTMPATATQEAYAISFAGRTGQYTINKVPGVGGHHLIAFGPARLEDNSIGTYMYWIPESDQEAPSTILETVAASPMRFLGDDSFEGQGTEEEPFVVRVDETVTNGLVVTLDGLYVPSAVLPAAPLSEQITSAAFDEKVQNELGSGDIPTHPTSYHTGINVGGYGSSDAYLVVVPIKGYGKYVFASGFVQDEPPLKLDMVAFVPVDEKGGADTPVYIRNDRLDMSANLRPVGIVSTDESVKVTKDVNTFDLAAAKLTRASASQNFTFGYPDSKGANRACGKMGTGVYWKTQVTLDKAKVNDPNVSPRFWLTEIPCNDDGTLVPYQVVWNYVTPSAGAASTVHVWLICQSAATSLINITTGAIKPLKRAASSATTGLPDYPTAGDGESSYEPTLSMEYFYNS